MSDLKNRLQEDIKDTMRARDKERLGVLRLLSSAIKQIEVDTRESLDDAAVLAVFEKEVKKRRDSHEQYSAAGRDDLATQEAFEIDIIKTYMPTPLGESELASLIDAAIAQSGAASMKDMGKVMGLLKSQVQGRADMGALSAAVKGRLS